jgi:hypothetical protein
MQTELKILAVLVAASLVHAPFAVAQQDSPPVAVAAYVPPQPVDPATGSLAAPARPALSQPELEQMLAPIALYPDALLSQVLMASTYPLEVVQAARWSRANPGVAGDEAVKAVEQQEWDPSVKSLVAFPQVLAMLDENINWTERMGEAFLSQQAQLMLTVQNLRQRAQASGNLASNNRMRVEQQGSDIVLEPSDPQQMYVPYYDPEVAYGPWISPAYPPAYYSMPLGYYPAPGTAFYWGPAIAISAGFFFGGFDWFHYCVSVVSLRPFYLHPGFGAHAWGPSIRPGVWQHDAMHRRGVAYGNENLRQQYGGRQMASVSNPQNAMRGMSAPAHVPAAAVSHQQGFAPPAPAEQRSVQRAVETRRIEAPIVRERTPAVYNDYHQPMQPMRVSEARSFAQPYVFRPAVYAPTFSTASSYSHAMPRPGGAGSVSFAHFAGSSGGGRGGGGGGGGGGHGGGGHSGGGHGHR